MAVGYMLSPLADLPNSSASLDSIEAALISTAVFLAAGQEATASALAAAACVLFFPHSALLLVGTCMPQLLKVCCVNGQSIFNAAAAVPTVWQWQMLVPRFLEEAEYRA